MLLNPNSISGPVNPGVFRETQCQPPVAAGAHWPAEHKASFPTKQTGFHFRLSPMMLVMVSLKFPWLWLSYITALDLWNFFLKKKLNNIKQEEEKVLETEPLEATMINLCWICLV